jgi:UDPglucose--hexose-1-phosphate uridylyltransferase
VAAVLPAPCPAAVAGAGASFSRLYAHGGQGNLCLSLSVCVCVCVCWWVAQMEAVAGEVRPPYDPTCYLCPGNARAGGTRHNPAYDRTYVFTNDFPALLERPDGAPPPAEVELEGMLRARATYGTSRVVCFSPRHDLTVAEMPATTLRAVVDALRAQSLELSRTYAVVQIFENKGRCVSVCM